MYIVAPIVRTPKESEMSLSTQVKESVMQASDNLRDAIAFAARGEHPIVISMLSDMITRLESLEQMDEIMEKFGGRTEKKI
jgi:hypothetical protein